jgi:hypothetical protein
MSHFPEQNAVLDKQRELTEKHASLTHEVTAEHLESEAGAGTPIGRLSAELLVAIFSRCRLPEHPVSSARDAPYLLCQIYHWWREIALGTPALWWLTCPGQTVRLRS